VYVFLHLKRFRLIIKELKRTVQMNEHFSIRDKWRSVLFLAVLAGSMMALFCSNVLGQELLHSEAGIAAHDNGECVSGVPGSQTISLRSYS